MAKRSHKVSFKGRLDAKEETITEVVKVSKEESVDVVFNIGDQIRNLFREFHGCVTSFTLNMETEAVEDAESTEEQKVVELHAGRH